MARDPKTMEAQRRTLEDAFFLQQDRMLIEKRRALRQMEQSKRSLSEVSGIADDAVLTKLVSLGIQPETLASLEVVPLVAVAWADGQVDPRERDAVLRGVAGEGAAEGRLDVGLLEGWLSRRPGPELMAAWKHYIESLCECLSPAERESLKFTLLDRAWAVAKATGSLLGLTTGVSAAEQAVLKQIEAAFRG